MSAHTTFNHAIIRGRHLEKDAIRVANNLFIFLSFCFYLIANYSTRRNGLCPQS